MDQFPSDDPSGLRQLFEAKPGGVSAGRSIGANWLKLITWSLCGLLVTWLIVAEMAGPELTDAAGRLACSLDLLPDGYPSPQQGAAQWGYPLWVCVVPVELVSLFWVRFHPTSYLPRSLHSWTAWGCDGLVVASTVAAGPVLIMGYQVAAHGPIFVSFPALILGPMLTLVASLAVGLLLVVFAVLDS